MMLKKGLLAAVVASVTSVTFGQEPPIKEAVPPAAVLPIIQQLGSALNNVRVIEAPGGLIMLAGTEKASGKPTAMYVTPDGKAVIVGMVMDNVTKRNSTADSLKQLFPGSNLAKSADVLAANNPAAKQAAEENQSISADRLADVQFATSGSGKKIVYAFVDPQCGWCKKSWREIREWQQSPAGAAFQVRWVPIAISESSTVLAASMLGAQGKDARNAMTSNAWSAAMDQGKGDPENVKRGALLLEGNMDTMRKVGVRGTPTFFVISDDGKKARRVTGYRGIQALLQ